MKDYETYSPSFGIEVINYESLHKINTADFDAVVLDEAHTLGAFPKPSNRAKMVKEMLSKPKKVILLSGTPTPESYSQMYHQVYGIPGNPFGFYANFYKFANDYVTVTSRKINGFNVNDYSKGSKEIIDKMSPYTISYTQKEAGFVVDTKEHILTCNVSDSIKEMVRFLRKNKVIELESGDVILADSGAKMMTKIHQLCSGTIKCDSGSSLVLDYAKPILIKEMFKGKKIGIFYKFKAELTALKTVFGDSLCTEIDEFNSTDKNIALQIVSGREGISLRNAKALVFFNIDFSATSYWQARDRMTTIDRLNSDVYWVFSDVGMEKKIYELVKQKKDYTLRHFRKDFQ